MSGEVEMPEVEVVQLRNNENGLAETQNVCDEAAARVRLLDPQVNAEVKRAQFQFNPSTRFSVSTERITYSWNNISAWTGSEKPEGTNRSKANQNAKSKSKAPWKSECKSILNNVSGIIRPGEFVAIMGASGAGKTTLLDILSFRNSSKMNVSGTRVINGAVAERNRITAVSAYVQQSDLFFGVLTVREHLIFQAKVRMHRSIPHQDRMERVKEVIQEFGLEDCADTKIGTKWFKGISGGEMKRLSIATEVLTDPMLMFCDEPTSGLDSSTAQNVILTMRDLASKGKTVMCTIHQPSSQLFALFDKVLLITEGRVAFLGSAQDALKFFSKLGFECPAMFNPADFFVETLSIKTAQSRDTVMSICDAYEESPDGNETRIAYEEAMENQSPKTKYKKASARSPYKTSWLKQFVAVLHRSWISYTRDPMVLPLRIGQTVILALFVGTIFFQLDLENFEGMQNLNGAIFMLLCCLTYQHIIGTLDSFCSELPVFLREHFNGMYRTDIYYLSKILVEIPFFVILPALLLVICYFMVGFYPSVECFAKTLLIMVLVTNICSGVGYIISCVASSVTVALILVPLAIFPFFLFGGFLLRPGTGPIFLVWIEYISWFFYGFESMAIVQLEKIDEIKCNLSNGTCPPNGLAVLESQGFDKDNYVYDTIILGILAAGAQTIAFFVLLSRTFRQ